MMPGYLSQALALTTYAPRRSTPALPRTTRMLLPSAALVQVPLARVPKRVPPSGCRARPPDDPATSLAPVPSTPSRSLLPKRGRTRRGGVEPPRLRRSPRAYLARTASPAPTFCSVLRPPQSLRPQPATCPPAAKADPAHPLLQCRLLLPPAQRPRRSTRLQRLRAERTVAARVRLRDRSSSPSSL